MELIAELVIIFVLAAFLAYLSKLAKQPIIPAYILAGLILVITGWVTPNSFVMTISELGIAFLLFIVGMEIDLKRIKDVGLVSSIGGVILTSTLFGVGFLVALILAFSKIEAIYIGMVLAFSSTMIVIKLLSDRNELDSLHGRIILGFLLIQDILAILALFILSTANGTTLPKIIIAVTLVIAILAILYIASKAVFPAIFEFAAKSEEMLFTTSIAVCLSFIGIAYYFNFSIAIGAFLAGLMLGNLPYNIEIISLTKPLRDFFSVIFFVALGMQVDISTINQYIIPIVVLIILTITLKPFITMLIVSFFGYMKRPSYLTAIGLAQASEFSLILGFFGVTAGHISQGLFSSIIVVAIFTMALTTYFFEYESWFYKKISHLLGIFERITERGILENVPTKISKDVILVGCDRLGYGIFNTLKKLKKSFIVVDYNPEIVRDLIKKKIPVMYGDIGDLEILRRLDLKEAKIIVSTAPNKDDSLLLLKKTREVNSKAIIMLTSGSVEEALDLYRAGADYVILPHFLGGERVSLLLEEIKGDVGKVMEYKITHLKELKKRSRLRKHRQKK